MNSAFSTQSGQSSRLPVYATSGRRTLLQRKCACGGTPGPSGECAACRAKRLGLQRAATQVTPTAETQSNVPPIVHEVLRSSGQPLDSATRALMEPRFGHDFSRVRIHTNAHAAGSAQAVNALAYTVGHNVVFDSGRYAPNTPRGQKILAHELTHVVQQSKGIDNVAAYSSASGFGTAEQEAQSNARAIVSGRSPIHTAARAPGPLQRLDIEDCSADHTTEINQAAAAVSPAVRQTITAILSNPAPPALSTYFGATAPNYAAHIGLRLAIIAQRLQSATIECENPDSLLYNFFCGGNLAYVRPVPAFFGLANIHVCQPQFHNLTATQQMTTLVHEGAHRYIGATDEAYYTLDCAETAATQALSDSDRRDNADSFACLVQTLG